MKHIAVIGLGKVGSLVGTLLSDTSASLSAGLFTVTGFDQKKPFEQLPFDTVVGDTTNPKQLQTFLSDKDAVVSCLPYHLNLTVAKAAHALGIHYFDLTEDVATTDAIRLMADSADAVMAPQCGLAPGFIGIVGADLCKRFNKIRDIELRVGALPRYPNGLLGYSFTWSPAGVINEYINDAEVIHNGVRKMVPSLDGIETINIEGQEFEAFTTSGGLGTLCETMEGKVDTLNYKTIRYPGHAKLMRFLMYELILKENKEVLEEILTEAKPPVKEDVVYVYAVVEGWINDQLKREEFYHAYHPVNIHEKQWRAISWTTAASVVSVVEMVANGTLPQKGFIRQENIPFDEFLNTKWGSLYNQKTKEKVLTT